MFDIGLIEMLIVFVVALLVIGPERLPGVARTLGKYFARFRRYVAGVRSDIERELHADELRAILSEQKTQIDDLQQTLESTRQEMQDSVSQISSGVQQEFDEAAQAAEVDKSVRRDD